MTFSRKIFISVFLSTFLLGSLLIWAAHSYMSKQTKEKFVSRYSVFNKILADTLSHLDLNTEALMLNAAKVVAAKDAELGLMTEAQLRELRDDLKMTHVFITNRNGKFIRSTNENTALIPNLFSFCSDYKKLITGDSNIEATPIIKPQPEPKPFKFLSIPSRDRKRIVEVGIRVDFIAKTLAEAASSDRSVISMSLYAPDGTQFGKFDTKDVVFTEGKIDLPLDLNSVREGSESYHFYSKVRSSHPKCCQCDVTGTSRNGEYYYVIESNVSKGELRTALATTSNAFLVLGFGNLLFAFVLSRILSRRLVRNIELAAEKVRSISARGKVSDRIGLYGKDEVAFLTGEFDRLLERLEDSQEKLVEAEKVQAKVQMAKEIAHNIRSPIVAIEMMLPSMVKMPEKMLNVLKSSVREIKSLSEKLRQQAERLQGEKVEHEIVALPTFLNNITTQKNLEFSGRKVKVNLNGIKLKAAFIKANGVELATILSNIVNNAADAYGNNNGEIRIELSRNKTGFVIAISDNADGIPPEYLNQLGVKSISFKGPQGSGLGLVHARRFVESLGGHFNIESELGVGTTVRISIPEYEPQIEGKKMNFNDCLIQG